jgi:hypothetical protein
VVANTFRAQRGNAFTTSAMKLFLDESGYTGADLMNVDQPWFVLASTVIEDAEANALLREFFKGVKAHELKHKKLRKTKSGQKRLVEFIKALKSRSDKVATSIVHKKYALVSALVEWWVEPSMHAHGLNMYERGANLGVTNLFYITMVYLEGHQFLHRDLVNFQAMMRERTAESYRTFWTILNLHFDSAKGVTQNLLALPLYAEKHLGFSHLTGLPEKIMDLALPTAFQTVAHWRKKSRALLEVFHDESSGMAREKWLWDQLGNPSVDARTFSHNGGEISFPLGITNTSFPRSNVHPQLQIADLIAGSTAEWCKSKATDNKSEYAQALEDANIANFVSGGIYPSKHVTPEELGTEGSDYSKLLNFVSSIIYAPVDGP